MQIINFHSINERKELSEKLKRYFLQDMVVPVIGSGFSVSEKTLRGKSVPSGKQMREHMIEKLIESEPELMGQLDNRSYSDISSYYNQIVDEKFQRKYIQENFIDVILTGNKKSFINIPFKNMYTLNFDDAIENNNPNIEVIVANQEFLDEEILKNFRDNNKTILYKIHGDAKNYIKYNQSLVKSESDYATSIVRNSNLLSQLSADLHSNSMMFIGCSLDDEIDLIYTANHKIDTDPTLKNTYYVTHKDISIFEKMKLAKYKIDTIIKLENRESYEEFYSFLLKINEDAKKDSNMNEIEFSDFKISIVDSNENTLTEDINYLVNSNKSFDNMFSNKIINVPSYFIGREKFKNTEILERISKDTISVIYGHRFCGKTYCLLDIYKRIPSEKKIYIPPILQPDESKLIDIIKKNENTIFFLDINTIEENFMEFIIDEINWLIEKNIRLIFTLTSSDKENLYVIEKIKNIKFNTKVGIENYYIPNKFNKLETSMINEKLNKTLLGNFSYAEKNQKTILDNIYLILSSISSYELTYDFDITNKKIDNTLLNEDTIQLMIILAIQNSHLTIKDIEKFMLNKTVGILENEFNPILQFAYIDKFEKTNWDNSSQKFICNSKVWLLKELQRISNDSRNIVKITKAYQNIIKCIKRFEKNNDYKSRKEIGKYIKFDEINDIFSDSSNKGARVLIDSIYQGLHGLLNDNFQYFHQRAKSLSWQDRKIESLEKALDFVDKAKHNIEIKYEKNDSYRNLESYKHICYTKAVILTKIAVFYEFNNYKYNNLTIQAIKIAFEDVKNLNYLEEDNKRGIPNSIVTFIKKVIMNEIYNQDEYKEILSYLFDLIRNLKVPFNHIRYGKRKVNRSYR